MHDRMFVNHEKETVMTHSSANSPRVNPFYANRTRPRTPEATYVRLPRAPLNASPVPHLTSLYHFDQNRPVRRPPVPRPTAAAT